MADRPSRKLAVILHADVVASTQLVQLDESLAHERIQHAFHEFSKTIELLRLWVDLQSIVDRSVRANRIATNVSGVVGFYTRTRRSIESFESLLNIARAKTVDLQGNIFDEIDNLEDQNIYLCFFRGVLRRKFRSHRPADRPLRGVAEKL